jgi:hypothetical protein
VNDINNPRIKSYSDFQRENEGNKPDQGRGLEPKKSGEEFFAAVMSQSEIRSSLD